MTTRRNFRVTATFRYKVAGETGPNTMSRVVRAPHKTAAIRGARGVWEDEGYYFRGADAASFSAVPTDEPTTY